MSNKVCQWHNYQELIERFKEAKINGDVERMEELKKEIHELCVLCGAIPNKELMKILEDNTVHVQEAMTFIERCITNGNVEPAETIINDINRIAGCNSEKCQCHTCEKMLTMINFEEYEIRADGSLTPFKRERT